MRLSARLALALSASTLLMAAPAFADMDADSGHHAIYFRGAIGLTKPQGMEYDINAGEVQNEFDKGAVYSGAIGYDFGDYALEVELAHRSADIDTQELLNTKLPDSAGSVESTALMVNGYYETPTDSKLQPYIGLGVGTAQVDLKDNRTGTILLVDDGDRVFAYQGMAGLNYNFTPKLSMFAEYKYFATATVPVTTATATNHEVAYENHNFTTGLKYKFK